MEEETVPIDAVLELICAYSVYTVNFTAPFYTDVFSVIQLNLTRIDATFPSHKPKFPCHYG